MLNKMITARITNILGVIAILTISFSVQAQEPRSSSYLSCIVAEEDAEGEWIASRDLTESNGTFSSSRDTYEWRSKQRIQFDHGATMKWDISYYWPAEAKVQKVVPEDEVMVSLNFWYDAKDAGTTLKKPERTWIHLYRSTNPEKRFSFTDISLTSVMLWQQHSNGNLSTKAVIPLDHLLAFGAGFDKLVWNIRSGPDQFGVTQVGAKGLISIAAMRGKVLKIPTLRRLLDKKAANFRTECQAPSTIAVPQ